MLQDRFVRIMLVVIAVLLALNLASSGRSFLASPAQAQTTTYRLNPGPRVDVKAIKGYEVQGLTDIVALGDGKSFVVAAPGKFMVYQVETTQP
jgi:hypothetical protein